MTRPTADWRFTAYVLTPRTAGGRPEFWSDWCAPGQTVRPYPAPRTFLRPGGVPAAHVDVIMSDRPVEHIVAHRLGQPDGLPDEPRIDPFAVGRLLTAVARPASNGRRAGFDIDATLSCAFQVARLAVPAGRTPRTAYDVERLVVRLGMRGQVGVPAAGTMPLGLYAMAYPRSAAIHPLDFAEQPLDFGQRLYRHHAYRPRSAYLYPPQRVLLARGAYADCYAADTVLDEDEWMYAVAGASAGGQRFDRVAGRVLAAAEGEFARCGDRVPPAARTVSIGWGWEAAADASSDAFLRIAEGRAETFSAVDCRRPPGWWQDFDLSCLLDEPSPESAGPVHLWVGVWATSGAGGPIDFPDGGPTWQLPHEHDPDVTHGWVAEGCAAMGFWTLTAQ
jgi:hypothetical protein